MHDSENPEVDNQYVCEADFKRFFVQFTIF